MTIPNHLSVKDYQAFYQQSIDDPATFWAERAQDYVTWFEPWQQVMTGGFEQVDFKWFVGGKLNVCYNCVDRHLSEHADEVAILWEGDDANDTKQFTYQELSQQVNRFANVLKARGIKKGDRVCIYLPMIPEAAFAMLACARIGAIHSVVFGGFSPKALESRILDADCKMVITADEGVRGGRIIPLKKNTDEALKNCPAVETCLVVKRTGSEIAWQESVDVWYHDLYVQAADDCDYEIMDAEDPLFILYTSGSTGTPKGVVHTCGGYLVYTAMTHQLAFGYQPGDVYWCTADVGWITGHSYIVYGPLCNRATTLMFEGTPMYPDASRCWQIVDKYQVKIFYTAPTAIRALRREGDQFVKQASRQSLEVLGSVGEPINPEAWQWYFDVVGDGRCPVVDTWWQTETGGFMIAPFPYATAMKAGSASWPGFGVAPSIIDQEGKACAPDQSGYLLIDKPWPGLARTIYGDHQRFVNTYFKVADIPSDGKKYVTGDSAFVDAQGYYWIAGRVDDVINVSGHRLGTAEIESALLKHQAVAEAAVVGIPHEIKGQGIYAFVNLQKGTTVSESLTDELMQTVKHEIGSIAKPCFIQFVPDLPKTRSGKIMRRILRKIAVGEKEDFGDISTLADPEVVKILIDGAKNHK